ncbi:MAG TPA: fumarylacetoacetate hydrolase family protein [Phycisphaerales bacterium]|nr:fumarylacetoacetate hydrolase family protein [Phycisphaerales bacterium]
MHLSRADHTLAVIDDRGHATPIRHIIGIGRNYAEHAKEQGAAVPDRPMLFTKNLASLSMSGEDIVVPRCCQDRPQVDFEGELGVITGPTAARDVPLADAMNHVLAYCVANDVSARWWQKEGSGGQFYRGKSFDTFCPISTPIAAASIANPQGLSLVTKVNGHTMQDGTTRDMIFSVATLIHEISKGHTLLPGTLILTGTPSGVGMARNPQVWLKDGDTIDISIPHVGTLTNRVRFE